MRRVSFLAVACLLLVAVLSLARGREAGANAAQAWEYKLVVLADVVPAQQGPATAFAAFEARFNELGRDGWEYAGYLNGAAVFKRPKP